MSLDYGVGGGLPLGSRWFLPGLVGEIAVGIHCNLRLESIVIHIDG